VRLWLDRAEDDLLAADAILASPMRSFETVSFHAQQAAEKALKALLIRHQIPFRKVHDLGELLHMLEPAAPGMVRALGDAETLTTHAVDSRYPTEHSSVDRGSALGHLATARRVFDHVRSMLASYLEAGPPGR
jgi:HEPN domain-containing protein